MSSHLPPQSAAYMRRWNWVIIGSDQGLSPIRRLVLIWTNDTFSLSTSKATDSNHKSVATNQLSLHEKLKQ